MPAIKRTVAASTQDALTSLKFKTQDRPALVTLYASANAISGAISFSVGQTEFLVSAEPNLEVANQVVDTDQL